jgi:hypothetical protein
MVAGDMVEEMRANNAKVAINRRSRSTKESPAVSRVLGHIWVSVVQERDHDDEVVDDTPRDDVDPEDQRKAFQVLVEEVETSDRGQTAEITQQYSRDFALAEHTAPGIEVGVPPGRKPLLDDCSIRSGDVGQDVPVPSNKLLEDDPEEQDHRRILADFLNLVQRHANTARVLIALRRYVIQILLDVVGVDMMATMTRLPAEVGGEQERVKDETNSVVQDGRLGEAAVASIVGDDPEAGPHDTLTYTIGDYDAIVQ